MSLRTSLVSVWELNEASGNAVDSYGANTLSELSGTIAAGAGPSGLSGSRDFEAGDTEYFELADNADLSCDGTTFAITCWINFESIAAGTQALVCKANLDAASTTEYCLVYTGGGTSRFRLGVSTGAATTFRNADSFGAASTGTWYFIYAYYNTSTNTLGISVNNGPVDTTSYSSGVGATAQAFRLGADNTAGFTRVVDGLMAQVALWKRQLTADEVTELYAGGAGKAYSTWGGTITITDVAQYEAFQIGADGLVDIPVSGNCTGSPTAVLGQFNGGAWATIDPAPGLGANGVWSGFLYNQTPGSGTLTVKSADDATVTASVSNVRATNVFAWGGDSISEGRLTSLQSGNVSAFREDNAWVGADPCDTTASTGTFCPLVSALHEAKFGYPCAFITAGEGSTDCYGSGVNGWAYGGADYNRLVTQTQGFGWTGTGTGTGSVNTVKGVVMFLGPNAIVAASTPTKAAYNAAVDAMVNGFAADIDGAPKTIMSVCGEVSTGSPPDRDLAENNVRTAIIEARNDNSNVAALWFQPEEDYSDGVHPKTNAQALRVARRLWMAMENAWFSGTYGVGPQLVSAVLSPAKTSITVTFHRALASLSVANDAGFRLTELGSQIAISAVTTSGSTAVLTLATPAVNAADLLLSFGYGDDAVGLSIPTSVAQTLPDASTETLPAEIFIEQAVTQGTGTFSPAWALGSNQSITLGGAK